MKFEVEVISKETIKPCSSTPESLQQYQLSFLDQVASPVFMPIIYFYEADSKLSNSQKSNHLKKSLSQVLPIFYPLAGRLAGNLHVDCNDAGAPFFEAEANCNLSQVITNPIPKLMNKFLPYKLDDLQNLGVAVQVTTFQCGGLAVGLVMSHKIADALSFFFFANTWATLARDKSAAADLPRPRFDSAAIFPPRNISGYKESTGIVNEDDLAVKIFTFPGEKISHLREMYSDPSQPRPTRVEALSAFIWSRFVSALDTRSDPNMIHIVLHAINLRTRVDPPLSENHFGNISRIAIAVPTADDGGYELLQKVREAIKAVDGDFVARLRDGDKHLNYIKELMTHNSKGQLLPFNFTSLCRFPLYEANFGWGKPVWVGSAGLTFQNLVTFMDTASGDGIDAWIILKKENMEKFEADLELQKFLA
ncbi:hypothetical protein ACS0TY_009180 [Phlomoides rotata]